MLCLGILRGPSKTKAIEKQTVRELLRLYSPTCAEGECFTCSERRADVCELSKCITLAYSDRKHLWRINGKNKQQKPKVLL